MGSRRIDRDEQIDAIEGGGHLAPYRRPGKLGSQIDDALGEPRGGYLLAAVLRIQRHEASMAVPDQPRQAGHGQVRASVAAGPPRARPPDQADARGRQLPQALAPGRQAMGGWAQPTERWGNCLDPKAE
jgi:hypothetical protein